MQTRGVDDVMADCRYIGLQSQSSSDTAVEDSRCSAGNGCFGDGTSRTPEKCVEVSSASPMLLLLMMDLLRMLTLRPQRYEPSASEAFALCTRLPCYHNLGDFAACLQDG